LFEFAFLECARPFIDRVCVLNARARALILFA
jgi:hypothetical protein